MLAINSIKAMVPAMENKGRRKREIILDICGNLCRIALKAPDISSVSKSVIPSSKLFESMAGSSSNMTAARGTPEGVSHYSF